MPSTSPPLPVVYLPGASGNGAVFGAVASLLARRRSPLLVDYPGLSAGRPEPRVESFRQLCEIVVGELPARFDLASLSMGSSVALFIARRHPERVRHLVLVAPAGSVDARRLGGLDFRPAFRARRPGVPEVLLGDELDEGGDLSSVAANTLLVFGERDLVAPVAVGEALVKRLPHARLEIVPGATHDLEAEQPDIIASLIEAHLRT